MTDNDLLPLLRERMQGQYIAALGDAVASMTFTGGGLATWTLDIAAGRVSARRGAPAAPNVTVRAALPVLRAVIAGERSGVHAFLDGELTVRGNLALALQMDGLFPSAQSGDPLRTITQVRHIDGIETFYLESGPIDAPPVVLVHGLSASNASMLPLFAALARDYRVLAPDLPGHGATQARHAAHSPAFLGSWLTAFLRETCAEPVVVIGNSLGGRTALQSALDAPDLISGLVLLCPAVALRRLRQFVPLVRLARDDMASLPFRIPRPIALRGLRQLFADDSRLPAAWYEAAVDEFLRTWGNRENRYAVFSALRHLYLDEPFGESGFWIRLRELGCPALFVWGAEDLLVPAGFARFVSEALPSADSIVLEDCGHVPQFEQPERTIELTRAFLGSLQPSAAGERSGRGADSPS